MTKSLNLPGYTDLDVKAQLLAAGASGTIYALVMPESEAAIGYVVDGCDQKIEIEHHTQPTRIQQARNLASVRERQFLTRFREPWTQKQDAAHTAYFDRWVEWASPIVSGADAFQYRYPTAGASEGIFKIMSEYAALQRGFGTSPSIAVFTGEYEGFSAFAESLRIPVTRLDRSNWREELSTIPPHAQFWISQPSAVDGMVWDEFTEFAQMLCDERPDIGLIPDLSYVGAVAREFTLNLDLPCIDAFVISHSKPMGGYYLRCGGVFARDQRLSLFGNKWFKNLVSLAWGTEMMTRHGVYDLPRRYRPIQERACSKIGARLGFADNSLKPADVMLVGIAPAASADTPLLRTLLRGSPSEQIVRICLTPLMSALIDPKYAPDIVT